MHLKKREWPRYMDICIKSSRLFACLSVNEFDILLFFQLLFLGLG